MSQVPTGSYGHRIQKMPLHDHYRLTWYVYHGIGGSRLITRRGCSRDTDLAGARRFAAKWKVALPA